MPLPTITSGKTQRCTAKCKARGGRCLNPAAWGCSTCRYHGARKPQTVRRGDQHWNYQHGQETLEAKAQRHDMSVFFQEAEALSFAYGLVPEGTPRWRGRKPKG